MRSVFIFPLLMLMASFIVLSCLNEPDCNQQIPADSIAIKFFDIGDVDSEQVVRFNAVSAEGTDLIFYNSDDSLSFFSFDLDPLNDTITLFFEVGLTEDTLQLTYTRRMRWLSEVCGPHVFYDNLDIHKSTFDSVGLVRSQIDGIIEENIRIYN